MSAAPSFDRVIAALERCGCDPVSGGNGSRRVMARCPAHADNNPSLSIKHDGTRTAIHCFRGCDTEDVLVSLALRWEHLFDDFNEARKSRGSGSKAQKPDNLLVDMKAAVEAAVEDFEYPLRPIAAKGFLTVIAGKHSARKTLLMLLAGHAVHSGEKEIAGLTCARATVLYVDAENGPRLLGRRFRDAGIPPDGLLVADGSQIPLPKRLDWLDDLIADTGAGLVVLDSLRRLTPGLREDKSDDMAPVVAAVADLARKHDAAIVLVHHRSSKDGAADVRGSSAIEDQADIVFKFERRESVSELHPVKYRIDEEPEPLAFEFDRWAADPDAANGTRTALVSVAVGPGTTTRPRSKPEMLADQIRKLADVVRASADAKAGWSKQQLAAAVGESPDAASFRRALELLEEGHEWVAVGATRARRYRPADSAHSVHPLGKELNEQNGEDRESPANAGDSRDSAPSSRQEAVSELEQSGIELEQSVLEVAEARTKAAIADLVGREPEEVQPVLERLGDRGLVASNGAAHRWAIWTRTKAGHGALTEARP